MNTTTTTLRATLLCLMVGLLSCSQPPMAPRTAKFTALPDWSGIWLAEGKNIEADISGYPADGPYKIVLTGDDPSNPAPWTKQAADEIAKLMATGFKTGKARAWGVPLMMESPAPLQFLVTPEETLIINSYRDARHVYTDGRSHLAEEDRWPAFWGDSIGHWEGDTLVIDTLSVKRPGPDVAQDKLEVFPIPMLSEQAHFVERLRMTGPDRIEGQMTIEDPIRLTKPWIVKLAWKRASGLDRMFPIEFDNDRVAVEGDSFVITPSKK